MEQTAKKGNGLGVAGLVMGILGILFIWFPFLNWLGWIFAALALIFGLIGCFGNKKSKGIAIAAVVLAIAYFCIYYFYWAPKYKALGDAFKTEVVNSLNEESTKEAVEKAIDEALAE